jgi:archaellum component FlaG (FlaF/FlaG flagellin family)
MRKGAILLFAFSLILLGCQAKTVYLPPPESSPPTPPPVIKEEPVPLPDLTISNITLDESGRLVVTLSNIGKNPFPSGIGSLSLYVDGDPKWSIPLERIPDQLFLQPGGISVYTTPVELEGAHSVKAVVDSDEEIVEEDESNNTLTKLFSFENVVRLPSAPPEKLEKPEPMLLPPDLAITDLSLNRQRRVTVTLANIGSGVFPLRSGTLKLFVDGMLKGSYTLNSLSDQDHLLPKESVTLDSSLTLMGRHDVYARIDIDPGIKERNPENNGLKKILEGLPVGPDLVIQEIELTEDLELSILLSNTGEGELRKGTTLKIRVFLNDQKVSEFDHFISEPLRPFSGNRYVVDPPYRIRIDGNSKVRVSIWPKGASDDIRLDNNTLEQYFTFYSFKLEPQKSQEFSFSPFSNLQRKRGQKEKVKAEVRWDGGAFPLRLSLKGPGNLKKSPTISGGSPLKLQVPIENGKNRERQAWRISVANLLEKKVEGILIIQTP